MFEYGYSLSGHILWVAKIITFHVVEIQKLTGNYIS